MKNYIATKIEIEGIKNLSNKVSLDLVNSANKQIERKMKKVVAVYGPNGAGKSAFVHGIEILKNVLLSDSYLLDRTTNRYVFNLVNKGKKEMKIALDFSCIEKGLKNDYRYEISLAHDNDESVYIKSEKFTLLSLRSERRTTKVIFLSEKGNIIETILSDKLRKKMENLIKKRSFLNISFENFVENSPKIGNIKEDKKRMFSFDKDTMLIIPLFLQISKMHYFILNNDKHSTYSLDMSDAIEKMYGTNDYNNLDVRNLFEQTKGDSRIVGKNEFEQFKLTVKSLSLFIQLFKSDLRSISIEHKEDVDHVVANLIFNYDDYSLNEDFESAGIKKLVDLFFFFSRTVNREHTLFIDELDSSINDIYLVRLVEYFQRFGNGQLVFTTHNVSPMDLLKKDKDCIVFLDSQGMMSYWKQVGSYSPSRLYKEGYIKGLPFNINAVDFGEIFYGRKPQ